MKGAIVFLAITCGALAGPLEDSSLQEFVAGNHAFTAAVYKELIKSKPGNIIVSPLSAEVVLALLNEGTKGDTYRELYTGLSLPHTTQRTQLAMQSLLPKLKRSEEDLKLLSANKIYVGKEVRLEDSFKSVATSVYEAGVDNIDFAKNTEAARTINQWVEDQTNNKIKNLIDSSSISEDTKIVLVNALYFSGKWQSSFEEYETRKKKFYKTKADTVEVDTMHQVEYLNYYENPTLNAKFLELPYKGGDISMVIVLPNEIDGLGSLEQNIEKVLQPQPFTKERVDVDLPKFTIETEIQFIPILKTLGIQRLFTNSANLTGLSSTHKNLYVSQVIQKAFINVTEAGTEAAAATAVLMFDSAVLVTYDPPKPYKFHADHPFFYVIKKNEVVLFAGRHNTP